MGESASDIIHNSRANAIKYRQVDMTPIMIDPVRREQQRQDFRDAMISVSNTLLTFDPYIS